jgi:hypothetical protein
MTKFSKREKYLVGTIIIFFGLIVFLSFKILDYKIDVFVLGGNKYSEPPPMNVSIKNASMIFLCKTELIDNMAKYKISEVVYKDHDYEFPYVIGDYFPRLQQDTEAGVHYGEGRVVILSSQGPVVFQHLQIMRGAIAGFDGISVKDFIKKVHEIKR